CARSPAYYSNWYFDVW
nr:immunoglobulin heavy chain junction region [Mus musculus]NSM04667.1 immunoglobulin heavy chain junction region [Mus musculus]NSM05871.1 immunoglobulin heavy chain junction region [Mus musculus]NSM05886.1 immunoglobulin heavy chain junction region [Mus musculus]NSM05900.1 immunoglobulin heavy chain junction region [Mus musculus]